MNAINCDGGHAAAANVKMIESHEGADQAFDALCTIYGWSGVNASCQREQSTRQCHELQFLSTEERELGGKPRKPCALHFEDGKVEVQGNDHVKSSCVESCWM